MKLNPLAAASLQRLIDEGIALDPLADFDAIAEINELADAATKPRPCIVTDAILDAPVTCGGVQFRALTIAAHLWLRDVATPALEHDEYLCGLAIPFAMANRDALDDLNDERDIRRAVKRWGRKACRRITDTQLAGVFRHFGIELAEDGDGIPEDAEDAQDAREQYGNVLALLIREYGGDPNYWIFEANPQTVDVCLRDTMLKAHYEAEDHRATAAKGGKAIAPDPNSPLMQSQFAMIKRVRQFRDAKLADGIGGN